MFAALVIAAAAATQIPTGFGPAADYNRFANVGPKVDFYPMGFARVTPFQPERPDHPLWGPTAPIDYSPYFVDSRRQIGLDRPRTAGGFQPFDARPQRSRSLASSRYGPQGPPRSPR